MAKMQPFWWFLKPEIICPEGEQIVNGGFETGDLPPWEAKYNYVTDRYAHTGTYSCYITYAGWTKQTVSIPVNCIKSFTLWAYNEFDDRDAYVRVIAHYTDDTSDEHEFMETRLAWAQFDMLPYLTAGKTIDYIRIQVSGDVGSYVDDVSLVGTG